jgi:hypothetical protein
VEQTFYAEVVSGKQRIRLVVTDGVDGWFSAVYYVDTKESVNLSQAPHG